MKSKSLLNFIFKATPARIALAITFYYGLLLIAHNLNENTGSDYFYFVMILPFLILGCGEFWGGHSPYCIHSAPLLLITVLGIIFLFFWVVFKIISLLLKGKPPALPGRQ
jgi:hypothetical protein